MRHIILVCLMLLGWHASQAINTIAIDAPPAVLENSITRITLTDVSALLTQACNCTVQYGTTGDVVLKLPAIDTTRANQPNRFSKNFTQYPYLQYPDHDYTWRASASGSGIVMTLETPSYQGIAFGLYGLLQEHLGFKFYHPKETIIPKLITWPLPKDFSWEAKARFDKKGFHLHTMHPLELTQQLLNHEFEGGIAEVNEYLDWLVRNGQNYFEFNLLEGISRKYWPAYAQQFVDYGKSRGIIMGVDVSLHMLQQNAYKLYEGFPKSWRPKQKQIDRNLDWLMAIGWDVVNMEFSSTEFSEGNVTKKEQQRLHITDVITNKYGAKLMGRKHVVKKDNMMVGANQENGYAMSEQEKQLDANRGILIHTVMFYTATEESAPVYGNENLKHMMDELNKEIKQRETWYYPESAYWITFDNSIPMYLLPYLGGRLDDIDTMAKHGVPGHVTFSSGWEWGYWTIDWSIARWSWDHTYGEKTAKHNPTEYLEELFGDKIGEYFAKQHRLHEAYLKRDNLMQYMVGMNITDEVASEQLNLPFHPRPRWMYRYLRYKADQLTLDSVRIEGVRPLLNFHDKSMALTQEYSPFFAAVKDSALSRLLGELVLALDITALRAQHRSLTIEGLLQKREAELNGGIKPKKAAAPFLIDAEAVRLNGIKIVEQVEGHYRYPVWLLARRHWSHTVYYFGYLYTTSNLHFWLREEKQVSNDRYGPFYRNIWHIFRTVGVVD